MANESSPAESSPVTVTVETPAIEASPPAEIEAVADVAEAVADSAVAVAEIEGARDVAIAEIHAETEQARIEADRERDLAWRDERITALETSLQERDRTITDLEARLTPPPSPEPTLEPAEAETILIPQSMSDENSETVTEAILANVEERPEAEPEAPRPVRVRRRLI
jgi:hypothetical protein